jgi:urate oxidase
MLSDNSYGKSGIHLVKVTRRDGRHEIKDLMVAVRFEGDFVAAHLAGDNSAVLPTDTMKNTVYALAKDHPVDDIESFGLHLAEHFLTNNADLSQVVIELSERPWDRLMIDGAPHPHAFARLREEKATARVTRDSSGPAVESGLEDLQILKSAHSAFSGFRRDRYTTLQETEDRLLATAVKAVWRYARPDLPFARLRDSIRAVLLETFAEHKSSSVQHTLYGMGEAVLARHPEVSEIRLTLPNRHHLLVDLSPFDLENRNEIFVATEEPYGLIEATLTRSP